MTHIFVGDVGTEIILNCGTDISSATEVLMRVKKPDGSTVNWPAVNVNQTSMKHVIVAGDFDMAGEYRIQAYVEMPSWKGLGETVVVRVSAHYSL